MMQLQLISLCSGNDICGLIIIVAPLFECVVFAELVYRSELCIRLWILSLTMCSNVDLETRLKLAMVSP